MSNIYSIDKAALNALGALGAEEEDLETELPNTLDYSGLMKSAYIPPAWVVTNFISEASGSMVSAKSGKGKTWVALAVALIAAKGSEVGVWKAPKPAKTLYIDGEMHPGDMKERIGLLAEAIPGDLDPRNFVFFSSQLCEEDCNILSPKFNAMVRNTIKNHGFELVVIDNLSSLMTSTHSENAKEWGDDWNNWMNRLIRDTGVAVLGVHHAGKGSDEGRGTSGRVRNLRFDWSASPVNESEDFYDDDVVSLKIKAGKVRAKTLHKMYFTYNGRTNELTVDGEKPKLPERKVVHPELQEMIPAFLECQLNDEVYLRFTALLMHYHELEATGQYLSNKKNSVMRALGRKGYYIPEKYHGQL